MIKQYGHIWYITDIHYTIYNSGAGKNVSDVTNTLGATHSVDKNVLPPGQTAYRGYPAKKALPTMLTHGW